MVDDFATLYNHSLRDVKAIVMLHNRTFVTLRQLSALELSILKTSTDDAHDNCILDNDKLQCMSSMPLRSKFTWTEDAPDNEGLLCVGGARPPNDFLERQLQSDAVLHRLDH